jgi:hypothetical protein
MTPEQQLMLEQALILASPTIQTQRRTIVDQEATIASKDRVIAMSGHFLRDCEKWCRLSGIEPPKALSKFFRIDHLN